MSIYDEIGGLPAVSAAVDIFYDKLMADSALSGYFEGYSVGKLKGHQRAFLVTALGGPEVYRGRSLGEAHAPLGVTSADFDKVVGHLVATLTELGVPGDTIAQIGALLGPTKSQIVAGATTPG